MNNQTIEVIDSSRMQVLADFRYVDEPINNIEHYYLGILDDTFLTRIKDLAGNFVGKVFFDRANYAEVIEKMEDVYAGKLKDVPDVDYFSFKSGRDFLVIGITSTFPHTSFKPSVSFNITNTRRVALDGDESGGRNLYMSLETGKKMLAEMKRIENQVAN